MFLKKEFTPAHMGRFTLLADPKSNLEHSEHLILTICELEIPKR